MTTIVEFLKLGTTAWTVPEGVSSVKVECLGAGGRGRSVNGSASSGNRRSGGGGGGYSSSVLAVTPGKTIATLISSTQTWFGSATTVEANAGSNAPVGGSGAGGGSGYGDITFYGGNGASTTQNSAGGGGGGSAGPSGNGWNATIGGGGGSNGGSGSSASGANGGSGSLGEGPTLPNAIAINGAGGSRSATGVQSGDGSTQRLWKSTAGEWAGPGGGGAAGNFSSAGNGGNYGGGGGGGGGASGETYTAGLGGEGLIVLTYTIAQPGFSHSYWL